MAPSSRDNLKLNVNFLYIFLLHDCREDTALRVKLNPGCCSFPITVVSLVEAHAKRSWCNLQRHLDIIAAPPAAPRRRQLTIDSTIIHDYH